MGRGPAPSGGGPAPVGRWPGPVAPDSVPLVAPRPIIPSTKSMKPTTSMKPSLREGDGILERGAAPAPRSGEEAASLARRSPPAGLPERMDAPDCDPGLLADALEQLARVARWTGGRRLLVRRVLRLLEDGGALTVAAPADGDADGRARAGNGRREITLLEVGAGSGHLALYLAGRLERLGWRPRVILADRHPGVIRLCRGRLGLLGAGWARFHPVRLDGARLPLDDRSVDIAYSSTTLHHLSDAGASSFLAELDRVSRSGWVVTDLLRSRLALSAIRFLARTIWRRHPLPRADGLASVRRSFTAGEVARLIGDLGLERARVRRRLIRWIAWRDTGPRGETA